MLAIGALAAVALAPATATGAGAGKGRPALPPGAVEVAPDTYFVGTRKVDGVELEGYAFVHRKRAASSAGKGKPGTGTCYAPLAAGAKWKTVEGWLVDDSSAPSGVGSQMTSLMTTDVGTWETAAGTTAIFGAGTRNPGYDANLNAVDNVNGAEFGAIADPGVIAVTYAWGRFGGPTRSREIVEWDMVFDNQDFAWATNGLSSAMDFRNISTHELGHAMGLGHPPTTCTEETMYAYATEGETKKRDLNAGDVTGINSLY
jgi:hypothetical protein